MVLGDALMFLGNYKAWMKEMQKNHSLKIGVLSVEYSTYLALYSMSILQGVQDTLLVRSIDAYCFLATFRHVT